MPPVNQQQQIASTPQDVSGPTTAFMSGPSDWEHFTPTDYMQPEPSAQELYTSPVEPAWRQGKTTTAVTSATPRQEIYTSPIQPDWRSQTNTIPAVTSGTPHQEIYTSPTKPHPSQDNVNTSTVPAPSSQPPVAPTKLPQKEFDSVVSTPVLAESVPGRPELNHLSSHGSVSSMGTVDAINPPDNIDSVIQAWNQPSTPKATDSSPQRANQSSTPSPLRVQQSKRPKPEERSDLYQDLDAEYHSSLARFVNMLRKESAASTDEEKFATFQTFMQRELRIRQILYGVETAQESRSPADQSGIKTKVVPDSYTNGNSSKDVANSPTITRMISSELQRKPVGMPKTASPIIQAANATTADPFSKLGNLSSQPQQQLADAIITPNDLPSTIQSRPTLKTENSTHQLVTQESPKLEQHAQVATLTQSDGAVEGPAASVVEGSKPETAKPSQQITSKPEPVTRAPPEVEPSCQAVVSEVSEEGEYSPGGRPRIANLKPSSITAQYASLGPNVLSAAKPHPHHPPAPASPSDNAPMVIEDYVMQSPSANAPMLVGTETSFQDDAVGKTIPITFEPFRPAYTPFQYDASSRSTPPPPVLATEQPADQAYSALRVQASENGRLLGPEALPIRPSTAPLRPESMGRPDQQESFLGLIRSQSKAHRGDRPATAMALSRQVVPHADPTTVAVSSLQTTLPAALPVSGVVHDKLTTLQREADRQIDNFAFIRDTVLSWDKHNRVVRAQLEKARDERQEISGRHLDELFNANEISYAELNRAEADFRVAEATSKYDEDQQELQSFSEAVFTNVTTRLHAELALLQPLYDAVLEILDNESDSMSRQVAGGPSSRVQMFAAMDISLNIFRKLEIRHQKLAEARFERERRRKKLELTVLYTNRDTAGVKRLEQDFNRAENLQVLKESQDRDSRANKMMDIFDRSAVRGLGDNQTLIDDLLAKTKKVKEALTTQGQPSSTNPSADTSTAKTLELTKSVIDTVWADSRSILSISNSADKLLNEADYAVSVADARVASASKAMFLKLEQDKAKEEGRLAEEMAVRLDGMAKAPTEATALIQDIMVKVAEEPARQTRMNRALEEAKRRNAMKEGQPG